MSKFFKMLPILAVGLIAALATVGCASTENQEPTETAVQRTAAVTYAAIDGSCEHDYEATQTFAATCTEQGYTVYTCANCGDSYTDNFVAAKGHTFQDIIVPATCTHKGYVTHFCTMCGYEYSDTFVDETGHDYTNEVTEPTCTEQGYTTHTCNTCGYSYKDSYVEALGHDYTEAVTEPTCTDGGYTTYTCQTCGNEVVADYTEAKGHTYSETVHPATCVSYGYTEHICSDCGDRYVTDYQKATGHTYLDIVVEATEDSIGYTRHLCVVCNYSYLSDFVTSGDDGYIEGEEPAHEHEYKLYVQDFETDKYFIALRVCVCGDSKVGNLNIQLSNADGKTLQLVANEYGQVDYADVYGDWLVTILDEDGTELSVFYLSAGEAPEEPTGRENPDEGGEPSEPENPEDGNGKPENPDDGEPETPENPDDGNGGETPEEPEQPADETGGGSTAVILLIVFVLLDAGGIGAVIFLKKRKNKNQN